MKKTTTRPTEKAPVFLLQLALALALGACSDDASQTQRDAGKDALLAEAGGDGLGQTEQDGFGADCPRTLFPGQVTNARDLGGFAVGGGQRVRCGQLMRGGDLNGLADGGCQELSHLGIQSVLDLRELTTQQNAPPPECVSEQAEWLSAPLPKLLPDTVENYVALLDETEAIQNIFHILAQPQHYPLYFHCVIGRDRASFVAALVLLALGAERATVEEEFLLSDQANVAVKLECIQGLMDELDARGGIETFLGSAGVSAKQLEPLRAHLLEG